MTREQQQIAERVLEETIDKFGVLGTLRMIQEICYGKAEHVETNWQDRPLANEWSKCAGILDKANFKIGGLNNGLL